MLRLLQMFWWIEEFLYVVTLIQLLRFQYSHTLLLNHPPNTVNRIVYYLISVPYQPIYVQNVSFKDLPSRC